MARTRNVRREQTARPLSVMLVAVAVMGIVFATNCAREYRPVPYVPTDAAPIVEPVTDGVPEDGEELVTRRSATPHGDLSVFLSVWCAVSGQRLRAECTSGDCGAWALLDRAARLVVAGDSIVVRAQGYLTARVAREGLVDGQHLRVELQHARCQRLRVVAASGQPVPGATVYGARLAPLTGISSAPVLASYGVADEDGWVRMPLWQRAVVYADGGELGLSALTRLDRRSPEVVDLVLGPPARLGFRCDGEPIRQSGMLVAALPFARLPFEIQEPSRGCRLPPAEYAILAGMPASSNLMPDSMDWRAMRPGEWTWIDQASGSRIRVVDDTGAPVTMFRVAFEVESSFGFAIGQREVNDKRGIYRLDGSLERTLVGYQSLPVHLVVSAPGFVPKKVVWNHGGSGTEQTVRLQRLVPTLVRFRNELGEPLSRPIVLFPEGINKAWGGGHEFYAGVPAAVGESVMLPSSGQVSLWSSKWGGASRLGSIDMADRAAEGHLDVVVSGLGSLMLEGGADAWTWLGCVGPDG
ncbi:MAG TPA: hypothetical protein ENI87_11245, partial [bacterium]|nr:hypothetical protein [bacterium]